VVYFKGLRETSLLRNFREPHVNWRRENSDFLDGTATSTQFGPSFFILSRASGANISPIVAQRLFQAF
jgi:hypothetical protein